MIITLVQADLRWENPSANRQHLDGLLRNVGPTDLVVLPEMFSTGFSMAPERLAEPMGGPSMAWMLAQARDKDAAIVGSLIIEAEGRYYNRLIFMRPDGRYQHYDKRHLFSFANEQAHYTAGRERLITEWRGWRICPLICYDLRFPVWSRNTENYDLLLYVANFPERRREAWRQLLPARAIENLCYVAGVNRVGEDGHGIAHSGDSTLIGPLGERLGELSHQEGLLSLRLDHALLEATRQRFAFLDDRDHFALLP